MRVLLTGASSFTGLWFAEKLSAAGHEVVAPITRDVADYTDIRGVRVERLGKIAEIIPGVAFGDDRFLELAATRDFDVLAHHAARVADYRSLDFDVSTAVAENTRNLRGIIDKMMARGLKAIVATGSVFENDAGIGDPPLEAFSPYGLSKAFSYQVVRFWAARAGLPLGRFVIPNPFGPYEEPRFGNYLMSCWAKSEVAGVKTPLYLRDNIHVDLLALAYARFVADVASSGKNAAVGPSGYVESQGAFAERFAAEMRGRLGLDCGLNLSEQTEFTEPLRRVNTDPADAVALGWSETAAWDGYAEYFRAKFAR